jgi:hypothetical protein
VPIAPGDQGRPALITGVSLRDPQWEAERRPPLPDRRTALAVGAVWTALTLMFEFGFGHYLLGTPWQELLADYDLTQDRIWILVPIATLVAPAVVRVLQTRTR